MVNKWEYLVQEVPETDNTERDEVAYHVQGWLDEHGGDGWELVDIGRLWYTFKRPAA